jgi:hypothetical protein
MGKTLSPVSGPGSMDGRWQKTDPEDSDCLKAINLYEAVVTFVNHARVPDKPILSAAARERLPMIDASAGPRASLTSVVCAKHRTSRGALLFSRWVAPVRFGTGSSKSLEHLSSMRTSNSQHLCLFRPASIAQPCGFFPGQYAKTTYICNVSCREMLSP